MTYQAILPTAFGALGIRTRGGRLCAIDFLPPTTPPLEPMDDASRHACASLSAYLENAHAPLDLPLELHGSAFQQRVWAAIRSIPPGCTLTYGELAQRVGSGARAVANACGANPLPLVIPCHRVTAKHGLGGFMQGRSTDALAIKLWLLDHERRGPGAA